MESTPPSETERLATILRELLERLATARDMIDLNICAGAARQELEGAEEE